MTIKQCYQAMGADFEEISQRIPSEAMIRKFAVKFPEDKSFAELTELLRAGRLDGSEALYDQLAQAYNRTVELLRAVD